MPFPTEDYFTFTVGTAIGGLGQIRVTVYRPANTGKDIPRLSDRDRNNKPREDEIRVILRLLMPHMLDIPPAPTATLVRSGNLRIDTQPATTVFRNIHIQRNNLSYGVVTVAHGAELCEAAGYQHKLLKYVKEGLFMSYRRLQIFHIRVKVERRDRPKTPFIDIESAKIAEKIPRLAQSIAEKIKHKMELIMEKRMTSAKNVSKIARGTEMIEHIAAAIEKNVMKLSEKEGAHIIAKKIPIVSTLLGCVFGAMRLFEGDFAGAFGEVASGVLADIPGPGTAASAAIDMALLGKDIAAIIKEERNHKRFVEHEIEDLKRQNQAIRNQIAEILPESPIYGPGRTSYFDESELANVDDITKIHVRCGDLIDGIQVEYRHGGKGQYHGGAGGGTSTFSLRPDERITTVRGTINNTVIGSLTFVTDCGREETFGKPVGEPFIYEMIDGSYLAAIKGYDMYEDHVSGLPCKSCPQWRGKFELLPALGFIAKF